VTDDRDSWLYAALETARSLEPTEAELAPVIAAVAARRRRRLSRGGRAVAIALPALLLAATAAAAATGLLPVGGVIRGVGFEGDSRPVVKETVEATGATKGVGKWRITTFRTKRGTHCMKLTLLDARGRRAPGPAASGYCGGIAPFSEFGHGRRAAAAKRGEVLLFGTAPARARTVELTGTRGVLVTAKTHAAASALERYWVLAAPAGLDRADLAWLDRRGRPGGLLDVSHRFAGPSARTEVATGTTPDAGRWRLIAYESKRLANRGDVYSPEGLPCLELQLLGPAPQRGGSCGVQPKTPGFTRGQARVLDTIGEPRELIMYGRAPANADAVEVTAGGRTISTETISPPAGVPGRFWLLARPPEDFANGHVYWVDHDSGARGRPVEVLPP
jgi:hypothetical protein